MILELGSLLIGAAGVGLNQIGQAKARKSNRREAAKAFRQNWSDLTSRGVEEQIAALAQVNAANRQARSAVSMARLSASEAGIVGNSAEAQQNTIEGERGESVSSTQANLRSTLRQLDRAKRGQVSLMKSRMNEVAGANPFLAGLQLAQLGINFAGTMQSRKVPVGGKRG